MGKRSVKFLVVFFLIHITERLLKGTWSYDVIDYFEHHGSCAVATDKKKVWLHKDKEGERRLGQFGRVHRLVFIVWMWFNQGRHIPPHHHHHHTPPPSQQQTSDRMQSRAGWHFICVSVCVQWHGCRGFEIIWPGEEHINSRCQTGRMKWKCT